MKVRNLITATSWIPGDDYSASTPAITVLMPAYRRGADGMFLRAAKSVLDQIEVGIELIIIDDASTDGTADQIDALMHSDGRVSCLRHRVNIGLPAVSEYEALLRARGGYLAFAFDDFVFEPDALTRLLEASEHRGTAVVHGYAKCHNLDGSTFILGRSDIPYEYLAYGNFIANSSFLVPRKVIDDIGFYDPHIGAVRMCDWDLWRRIWRDYPIYRDEIFVGQEFGSSRRDSLGLTYPAHTDATQAYCNRSRNRQLRLDALPDFDVWEVPPDSPAVLTEHILWARRFFKNKPWAQDADLTTAADREALVGTSAPLIGVVSNFDASLALKFEGLTDPHRRNLLFIPLETDEANLRLILSHCDAIVLVRHLLNDHANRVIRNCQLMDIPRYYLIDDNFLVLRTELPEFAAYTQENATEALADFAGVICTSGAVAEYLRSLRVHRAIVTINSVFDQAKVGKLDRIPRVASGPGLRVGFVGADFRLQSLGRDVLPALTHIRTDAPVEFVVRATTDRRLKLPADTKILPFSASFDDFLVRWRAVGLDILVHPHGDTANIDYKADSILLIALYLGAVPVVAADPAFREVGEEQGVLKVNGGVAAWTDALQRAQSPELRQTLMRRLEQFCSDHFGQERTVELLEMIYVASPRTDFILWGNRMRKLLEHTNVDNPAAAELAAIRASTSWRVTRPLRGLRVMLDRVVGQ